MYKLLMSNCLRNSHTKKNRNRLIFDKVIGKIKGGGAFFVDTLYIVSRYFRNVACRKVQRERLNVETTQSKRMPPPLWVNSSDHDLDL